MFPANVKVGEYTGARDLCCHVSVAEKRIVWVEKKAVAESVLSVFFRQTAFALVVSAAFASATGVAGEKLDMLFIQGRTGVNPEG